MSGIVNRTILVEAKKDAADSNRRYLKFLDWAVGDTGIGSMFEPFVPNTKVQIEGNTDTFATAIDMFDKASMINGFQFVDLNKLWGGSEKNGQPVHGGVQIFLNGPSR